MTEVHLKKIDYQRMKMNYHFVKLKLLIFWWWLLNIIYNFQFIYHNIQNMKKHQVINLYKIIK